MKSLSDWRVFREGDLETICPEYIKVVDRHDLI
jgi:hypothetical protein